MKLSLRLKVRGVRIANEILMYFRSLRKQNQEISLSEPIDNDSDGNAISLLDVISYKDAMLEEVDVSDRQQLLHRYIREELDEREQNVISLRYGLSSGKPMSQREVAERCGISRSYISRRCYCKGPPQSSEHAGIRVLRKHKQHRFCWEEEIHKRHLSQIVWALSFCNVSGIRASPTGAFCCRDGVFRILNRVCPSA